MELLLTNGKRVVTMDYKLTGDVGSDGRPLFARQNTLITSLWYGSASNLPSNGIEYNFVNGGKVVVKVGPRSDSLDVSITGSDGVTKSAVFDDTAMIYL